MIEALLGGFFGLLIGSFLNVCIYRLPRDLSVSQPARSFCPSCNATVAWYDNIPVLSYLLLRGRCRHCAAAISWRYPVVEIIVGVLFAYGVYAHGPTLQALKFCIFSAVIVALIFTDLDERILPDELTLGGALSGILFALLTPMPSGLFELFLPADADWRLRSVIEAVGAAMLLSGVLWGIGALYQRIRGREGLGFGDVKMLACIGAFLGMGQTLLTVIAGSVLGSFTGLVFIWLSKKDPSTYQLPFGTFLGVAALAVAILNPAWP